MKMSNERVRNRISNTNNKRNRMLVSIRNTIPIKSTIMTLIMAPHNKIQLITLYLNIDTLQSIVQYSTNKVPR